MFKLFAVALTGVALGSGAVYLSDKKNRKKIVSVYRATKVAFKAASKKTAKTK
jgi:hypothetical protein